LTADAIGEWALGSLDQARRSWFALCLRQPALARVLAVRERRTVAMATLALVGAFGLAAFAPLVPLLLGPVVFGVAHVASDVRYLVLRRRVSATWRRGLVVGSVALVALRALAEVSDLRASARLELALVLLWIAAAVGVAARERGWSRRATALALAGVAVAAPALAWPDAARLVFLHAHNLVALVIWGALFRKSLRGVALPIALLALGAGVLASGVLMPVVLAGPGAQLFGLHLLQATDWIAPGLDARLAVGLTTAFAFLQSAHYLTWLFLIPQEEHAAAGTPTFRMSARSLRRDFGGAGVVAVIGATLLVMVAACFALLRTRAVYLSLASFHGYLELAMGAYLAVRAAPSASSGALPT
jgi:hypothetical protein